MMQVQTIASLTSPLCFLPNGKLVCYNRGTICVLCNGIVEKKFFIPTSIIERFLGWSRYATRLLRFGIRSAIAIDNEHVIISIGNRLQELDLTSCTISEGWFCGDGIRPLLFSEVKGVERIEDGIYFGGYLTNMNKKSVNIYRRSDVDNWRAVYTFPQGTINHVHNIVADPYRNCLWVFTGDFDEAAAIWKVTDNFKKVECMVSNDQKYRGCVAYALPEGLLYATDTPFSSNHIYLFRESGVIEILGDVSGSCIYGCKWNNLFVFSSTVEADGRNETLLKLLFSWKRGQGIIDDYAHIYVGDCSNGFIDVFKEKKDLLPFLFQYGAFMFPSGVNNSKTLFFQPVATYFNDLKLMKIEMQ